MSFYLLALCYVFCSLSCLSMTTVSLPDSLAIRSESEPKTTIDSSTSQSVSDSTNAKHNLPLRNDVLKNVSISVSPKEASHALITVVQTSRIDFKPNAISTVWIDPDTLGTWTAPLSLTLSPGHYSIAAAKDGYREIKMKMRIGESPSMSFSIDLVSLEYLQRKREQWTSYTWISAGVSVVGAVSTYYFNNKVDAYMDRYNSASSPDVAQELRNRVNGFRTGYRLSSTVALVAFCGVILSWIIQWTYR